MKISMIQFKPEKFAVEKNYETALNFMHETMQEKPDIIVLPEAFDTGFYPCENLREVADKNGMRVRKIFSEFSRENSVNIVAGSITENRGGKLFNTSYIFDNLGEIVANYDKIHLFCGENKFFSPGEKIVSFRLNGVACGILICYDLRFLELSRILALRGVNLLFIVAQWPFSRISHFEILSRARAIENEIFVCALNGEGNSALISPNGAEILKFSENFGVKTAQIDLSEVAKMREFLPVFDDRRTEIYKELK